MPFSMQNAVNEIFSSTYKLISFVLMIVFIGGFFSTQHAMFMSLAIIPAFVIHFNANNDSRTVVSVIMLVGVLALTWLIAFHPAKPEAWMNWLSSKTMFVAIFGIFGSHLVDQFNWKNPPLSYIAIVVGVLALFAAYILKFPLLTGSEASASISAAASATTSAMPKSVYQGGDWWEDVLFGVSSLLFTAVIPKVVK